MKRKFLSILLVLAMCLSLMPTLAFADTEAAVVAKIGDVGYASLADAIEAVGDGQTIELQKSVEVANGISVPSGKDFTVDFNGFTYSVEKPGAGSAGTKTQAFQLLKNSTITFKNGTIECTKANASAEWTTDSVEKGVALVIQNYADLTLDNMTIDGTNIAHNGDNVRYVLSNNSGNVTIKDTTIIAASGDYAFDACKYTGYENSPPTVTVTGSTINGKVEITGGTVNLEDGTTVNGEVRVGENEDDGATGGTLNVNTGATVNTGDMWIAVFGANTVNVNGTVNGYITSNGNYTDSKININNGAVINGLFDVGVYNPSGTLNISGGTIQPADTNTGVFTAVYVKSGTANITGGTLIGNGSKAYSYNGSGANGTGSALVVESCNYPGGVPAVTVDKAVVANVDEGTPAYAVYGYNSNSKPSDVAMAVAAAKNIPGATVIVTADETLTARVDTAFTGTIDLNGHTLSSTSTCGNGSVFNVVSGEVTIKNGKMVGIAGPTGLADPYEYECDVITVRSGATANLEGLEIEVDSVTGCCAYAFDGGEINVKSGTYTNKATNTYANDDKMLLNQADHKAQAIFVTGGTFNGANPANGDNSGEPATFLADGYEVSGAEGTWVVEAKKVAQIGETKYATLAEAVAAAQANDTVTVLSNITLAARVDTNFTGTIDLNGHTLSSTSTCGNGSVFNVVSGEVTIKNGKMVGIAGPTGLAAPYTNECDVITVRSGATANLEGLEIEVDSVTGCCAYAFEGGVINVKSGTYTNKATGKYANDDKMLLNQADNKAQAIFVTGGTFNGANPANGDNSGTPATFLAEGYESTSTDNGWVVALATKKVAQIGDTKYETLAAAIAAVKEGETITMLADVTNAAGISIDTGKTFTIDFDGHTYSFCKPGAGSTGTQTQGFQILKGQKVTLKNGTLNCEVSNKTAEDDENAKPIKMLVNNYCDLTLDNMKLDGTNLNGTGRYTLSNNNGTVEIKNGSVITAQNGGFAFDSYYVGSASYSAPTVNVTDSTINGKVEATGGNINLKAGTIVYGQVRVGENAKDTKVKDSVVTVESGATVTNDGYAIVVFGANTLNVSGTVNGIIGTNGNAYNAGSIININAGAKVTENGDVAIYIPNGTLNVSGGAITGTTGIYFKAGTLSISGGTITGNGVKADYAFNSSGCNATGDAVVIDNCNYPSKIESVSITGGTFVSENGVQVGAYYGNGVTEIATITSTNKDLTAPEGYKWDDNGKLVKATYVAQIGSTKYETLADAIAAVQDDQTITMLADVTNAVGISINTGKTFTIDFANHTYSFCMPGAGSAGTKTIGFQILKDQTVILKNGTLNCVEANKDAVNDPDTGNKPIKRIIQNYANLVLEGMTIDGTNMAHNEGVLGNVVSINCGDVNIINSNIIAVEGDLAFDVCKYGTYTAPKVYVSNTGNTINGNVEVTGGELYLLDGSITGELCYVSGKVYKYTGFGVADVYGYGWVADENVNNRSILTQLEPVAKIGDESYYYTLAAAVAAANSGDTITLLADASGAGLFIEAAKDNLTLDLGGKTYTVTGPAVGSTGTQTQGLHIEAANFTLKNGTFTSAAVSESNVKMLVQNYGNLTLDGVTLDGSNISESGKVRYVLSNNSGIVTIKDTTIKANSGDFAFDTCKFKTYALPTVTVTGTSAINGDIELYGGNLTLTSGTLAGKLVASSIGDGVITKATGFAAAAPAGYKWDTEGTTDTLVKETEAAIEVKEVTTITFKNGGNEATEATLEDNDAAKTAYDELANNAAVTGYDSNVDDIDETVDKIEMTIKSITTGTIGSSTNVVTSATIDVQPKSGEEDESTFNSPVSFRLPIDSSVPTGQLVKISHAGDDDYYTTVKEETIEKVVYKFVRLKSGSFSNFTYSIVTDAAANIDGVLECYPVITDGFDLYLKVNATDKWNADEGYWSNIEYIIIGEDEYTAPGKYKIASLKSYELANEYTIYVGIADINDPYEITISLSDYFEAAIDSYTGDEKITMQQLYWAIVEYGNAAVDYFKTGTKLNVTTTELVDADKPEQSKYQSVGYTGFSCDQSNANVSFANVVGASLVLDSKIKVNVYIAGYNTFLSYGEFYAGNDTYQLSALTAEDFKAKNLISGVQDVPVYCISKEFTLANMDGESVIYGWSDGTFMTQVNYSVYHYIYRMWDDKDVGTLCKALATLGDKINAYVDKFGAN